MGNLIGIDSPFQKGWREKASKGKFSYDGATHDDREVGEIKL